MKVEVIRRFYNLIERRYLLPGDRLDIPDKQYPKYKRFYKVLPDEPIVVEEAKPKKKRGDNHVDA